MANAAIIDETNTVRNMIVADANIDTVEADFVLVDLGKVQLVSIGYSYLGGEVFLGGTTPVLTKAP